MRDYKLYIADIEEAIGKILSYTRGLDRDIFRKDYKTYDSVLHNLFIIGEAANKVPVEIRARHNEIDWRAIIGMRNVIAHGYFSIDPDIVWKTVCEDIPVLSRQFKNMD